MPRSALREIDEAGPEVIPTLKKALKVDDRRIRFYAVRLLGKVGPAAKEVLPQLYELQKQSGGARFDRYIESTIARIEGREEPADRND